MIRKILISLLCILFFVETFLILFVYNTTKFISEKRDKNGEATVLTFSPSMGNLDFELRFDEKEQLTSFALKNDETLKILGNILSDSDCNVFIGTKDYSENSSTYTNFDSVDCQLQKMISLKNKTYFIEIDKEGKYKMFQEDNSTEN